MSDQDNNSMPPDTTKSSWTNYTVTLLGLSSSLAVAGLLFGIFWLDRPCNLKPQTRALAAQLEIALIDHYVPPENIERGEAVEKSDHIDNITTHWTFQPFKVTLPRQLNEEGLRKILHKDMNALNVRVMRKERDPSIPEAEKVAFYLGKYEFAEMTLFPNAEEAIAIYRSDLRNSSLQLADVTNDILNALALAPPQIREDPVPREDLNSLWKYTQFAATLPPGMTLGALKERLDAAIALPDAQVNVGEHLQGNTNIVITLGGRACVGLACSTSPGPPPPRPKPVDLDTVLKEGIQGSTPDEATPDLKTPEPMRAPMDPDEDAPVVAPASPSEKPAITPPKARGADHKEVRLVIIIDDGGYVRADSDRVLKLDPRLTLAILPNTPYGKATAQEGSALGFEIMLHMPMETHSEKEQAVEGTIFTAMGKKEIQKLTNNALDQYPEAVGVNNHTGSKFTENAKKLGYVFEVLKKRDLFFIDSYTKNTSVAWETAHKAGLPTARRDVFLDNDGDEASIRAQLEVLVKRAIAQRSAIGIGHFQKPNTAKVLAEEIPKLKNAGIELVHASELVK